MVPDIPAARRKCEGLAWGRPCPAYDDGTFPEGCDCYMQLNEKDNGGTLALTMLTLAIAAIGLVAMTVIVLGADNDKQCLTKDQARVQYPGQHLYWHTPKQCWNNIRVYPRVDRTNKGDRLPLVDANGNAVTRKPAPADLVDEIQYREEAERRLKTCCWPTLPTFLIWEERIGK